MQLTRNMYVPMLDTSDAKDLSKLVPIDKSTIFELGFNAQTDTKSYICYKNDSTVINGYQPELPQEIVLDNSNPMYKFIFEFAKKFPTGSACNVPCVIAMPNTATGKVTDAMCWNDATITIDTLSTTDGKLSFKLGLNGDPVYGTIEGLGTATIKFKPAPVVPQA